MSAAPETIMELEVEEPLNTASASNKGTSLSEKLKAISIEKPPSKEPFSYILAVFGLCCVCLPATACLGICCCFGLLYQFVPLAEIIIGAKYYEKHYCQKEDVALILLVGGSIGLFHGLVECFGGRQVQQQGNESTAENGGTQRQDTVKEQPLICLLSILRIAAFAWFIYAAVVVFRFYGSVSYVESDENYCHPLLYGLLFWVVVISLSFLALVPIVLCCLCCVALGTLGTAVASEAAA